MLEGHPMVYHDACMVRWTRLPPSNHVLMLSTPLISKIKNKIRDINELKYKFRGVF
jgi:zona occludens toxin (predicted ATPase)